MPVSRVSFSSDALPVKVPIDTAGGVRRNGPDASFSERPDSNEYAAGLCHAHDFESLFLVLRLVLQINRFVVHELFKLLRCHAMALQMPRVFDVPFEFDTVADILSLCCWCIYVVNGARTRT